LPVNDWPDNVLSIHLSILSQRLAIVTVPEYLSHGELVCDCLSSVYNSVRQTNEGESITKRSENNSYYQKRGGEQHVTHSGKLEHFPVIWTVQTKSSLLKFYSATWPSILMDLLGR